MKTKMLSILIAFAATACGPPEIEDLKAIGKIVITNQSSRPIEVLAVKDIGDISIDGEIAAGASIEGKFLNNALPTECTVRWRFLSPPEKAQEIRIALGHLNSSPLGGYELIMDRGFTWDAAAVPQP